MPAVAYSPLFLIRPAKAHPVAFTARLPTATTRFEWSIFDSLRGFQ